jgi:hypothetical protein
LAFIGNTLFFAACTLVMVAIGWAGSLYLWCSAEVLVPLVLGLLGLAATLTFEGLFGSKRICREPLIPLRLFKNGISAVVFIATFFHGINGIWVLYFYLSTSKVSSKAYPFDPVYNFSRPSYS